MGDAGGRELDKPQLTLKAGPNQEAICGIATQPEKLDAGQDCALVPLPVPLCEGRSEEQPGKALQPGASMEPSATR